MTLARLPMLALLPLGLALIARGGAAAPKIDGQILVGPDGADRCVAVLARPDDVWGRGAPLATVYEADEPGLLSVEVSPALLADRGLGERALELLATKVGECRGARSSARRPRPTVTPLGRAIRSTFRRPWVAPHTLRAPPAPRSPAASR